MVTRSGQFVAGASLALAAAAFSTGYPQLSLLAGLSASAVIAALVFTTRPHVQVTCSWQQPRVADGGSAVLTVQTTNPVLRRCAALTVLPQFSTTEPAHDATDSILAVAALAAGDTATASLSIADLRRGEHAVVALRAQRTDPLGLARRRVTTDTDARLLVHPRTAEVTTPGRRIGSADEDRTSELGRRGGDVFHALREYQPGDDTRLIHWPSTARSGTLTVRDMVMPQVQRHIVVLDTAAQNYPEGLFEEAVRICASVAVSASRRHRVWLHPTCGDPVWSTPGQRNSRELLLDRLAVVQAVPHPPTRRPRDLHGAVVTVVTGAGSSGTERHRFEDPLRWGPLHDAVMVNVIRTSDGAGQHATGPGGALWVTTPTLEDFARRWNAWWRA